MGDVKRHHVDHDQCRASSLENREREPATTSELMAGVFTHIDVPIVQPDRSGSVVDIHNGASFHPAISPKQTATQHKSA